MARRRGSARRRRRGSGGFLYKLLSVLLICGCLVAAITLFFQVDTVVITGEKRYTEAEIREASGVEDGDNLFLLNKYQVIRNIADALPYIEIENTTIQRKLPDTLLIQVRECGDPLAWEQDGIVWLVSPAGKIVEQKTSTAGYPTIDGCRLLAPSVLTVQGDLAYISMDYMDRFTVKLDYDADFANKLQLLDLSINSGKIQDNMTGTFDMRYRADGRIYFQQNVRG